MTDWEGIVHPITTEPKMGPTERTRYVPNHKSVAAFLLSDQIRDPVAEVAEEIAAAAKYFSPVSTRGGIQEGVRMRDQFEVVKHAGTIKVGKPGNWRVLVEVRNDARSAAPNEFGTRKNKAHRMLGRAGAAFGDFKPEGGGTGQGPGGGDE